MADATQTTNGARANGAGLGDPSLALSMLTSGWRGETQRRVAELRSLTAYLESKQGGGAVDGELWRGIRGHLDAACDAAGKEDPRSPVRRLLSPADAAAVEATLGEIDAAEASLLRMGDEHYVVGHLPTVQAHVNRYLPKADPRRIFLDDIAHAARKPRFRLEEPMRDGLVNAYHAAGSQRRRDLVRAGSFFGVLVGTTIALTAVAIVVALVGIFATEALPVCFQPESDNAFKIVCPTAETPVNEAGAPATGGDLDDGIRATVRNGDLALVEFAGLLAAALAATAVLRNMRGTSTPFRIPLALALLKLPAGAVTAVVGLLLMRGGFVPGLTALDTSAQIVAWALIFGYAQQLATGLIDRQAGGVLNDVGGRGASGERPVKSS